MRVLLCVTGSVAAIKTPMLHDLLVEAGHEVKVVATEHGMHFIRSEATATNGKSLFVVADVATDESEWNAWQKRGDPVTHIELRRWADICVVAPLDANTLAKIACGMCDNLVTCVLRAWEVKTKPIVLAPAMNTAMWEHPLTSQQLDAIAAFCGEGLLQVAGPIAKTLVCGESGLGAMAEPKDIVDLIHRNFTKGN